MKKVFYLFLLLFISLLIQGCKKENNTQNNTQNDISGFSFYLKDKGYYVNYYNGNKTDLVIPESYKGLPVVGIGYSFNTFIQKPDSNVQSITIPSSVKTIEAYAFARTNLQKIIFKENSQLETIGNNAFEYTNLESIAIPKSVKAINSYAFSHSHLSSITLPQDGHLKRLGYGVFEGTNLTTITIPNTVADLSSISLDDKSLEQIIVDPSNSYYTSIDGVLFSKDKTTLIKFPEGKKLDSYIVPDSVHTIGMEAFGYTQSLKSITMKNNVTVIRDSAFYASTIETVNIPASVTEFGHNVFWDNLNLLAINIDENNPIYCSEDGVLFNKDKTELLIYPKQKAGEYTVPDSVESIGFRAFSDAKNLTDVLFTDNSELHVIQINAFSGTNLQDIVIPKNITSIGDKAFYDIPSLESVQFESNSQLREIDSSAFQNDTNLQEITIPHLVTYIGDNAFSGDANLLTVNFETGSQLYEIYDEAFMGTSIKNITIPSSVAIIGDRAFKQCNSLDNVNFEENSQLVNIGDEAFSQTNISTMTLPSYVTNIGSYIFDQTPMETLILKSNYPPHFKEAFYKQRETNNDFRIFVPDYYLYLYERNVKWKMYDGNVYADE